MLLVRLGHQKTLEADVETTLGEAHQAVDLVGPDVHRAGEGLLRAHQHLLARIAEPAHDGRAVYAVHARKVLEGEPAEEMQAEEVALLRLEGAHRVGEGHAKGLRRATLQHLETRISRSDERGREIVVGRDLAFALPHETDRLARRDDLHEPFELAAPGIVLDARTTALVPREELLANPLLHFVELAGREAHAHERAFERHDVALVEEADRCFVTGRDGACEEELRGARSRRLALVLGEEGSTGLLVVEIASESVDANRGPRDRCQFGEARVLHAAKSSNPPEGTLASKSFVKPACLDDPTLDDFVHARLSGEGLALAEAHIDSCTECSAIVSVLAGGEVPTKKDLDAELAPGAKIGRHVVVETLGKGAMGIVYLAYDPELDRRVALKLVRAGTAPEAQTRMLREAQAMAQIADPNVVGIFDVGRWGGGVTLAMEFVEGLTLRAWLGQEHAWSEVLDVLVQAGRGLAAAHRAGLVHRDFKPENVLVGKDGRVRVTDFGLARIEAPDGSTDLATLASTLTRTGALLGTPSYMAPELLAAARADATPASDQFAFGVTLYEAAFGTRPFPLGSLEELRKGDRRRGILRPTDARLARGEARDRAVSLGAARRSASDDGRAPRRSGHAEPAIAFARLGVRRAGPPPPRSERWDGSRLTGRSRSGIRVAPSTPSTRIEPRRSARPSWPRGCPTRRPPRSKRPRSSTPTTGPLGAARHATCEATEVRHEQSAALLDVRMHCLARRRIELDALESTFAHATSDIVTGAAEAAASLPRIEACSDVTTLSSLAPRPTGALGNRLAELETKLARAHAYASAGVSSEATHDAVASMTEAISIGYRPVIAEARLLVAMLMRRSGAIATARTTADAALLDAEASHDDRDAALAWLEILAIRGEAGESASAVAAGPAAMAAVARLGTPVDLEASVLFELGAARTALGDLDGATRDLEGALERRKRTLPEKHLDIARTLTALGNVARARGDLDGALGLHRDALAMDEAILGPLHPALARHHHNIAGVLRLQGKLDDALAGYRRALDLEMKGLGESHPSVGRTENSIGLVYLAKGDPRTAREDFEKAARLLESHPDHALVIENLALTDPPKRKVVPTPPPTPKPAPVPAPRGGSYLPATTWDTTH